MDSYGSKYGPITGCYKYIKVILNLNNSAPRRENAWGGGVKVYPHHY
jgi:hypothetical protein